MNLIDVTWIQLILINDINALSINDLNNYDIEVGKNEVLGSTYVIDDKDMTDEFYKYLQQSKIYRQRGNIVGFILPESNVSLIHFKLNNCETRIKEGSMVETNILGENTLYQVVNGITKDELNQSHSSDGFMCVIAQKLGHYNLGKNELEAVNWTPRMTNLYIYVTQAIMLTIRKLPMMQLEDCLKRT